MSSPERFRPDLANWANSEICERVLPRLKRRGTTSAMSIGNQVRFGCAINPPSGADGVRRHISGAFVITRASLERET